MEASLPPELLLLMEDGNLSELLRFTPFDFFPDNKDGRNVQNKEKLMNLSRENEFGDKNNLETSLNWAQIWP